MNEAGTGQLLRTKGHYSARSVLDCGGPPPLLPAANLPMASSYRAEYADETMHDGDSDIQQRKTPEYWRTPRRYRAYR
jgi:hypothetical protein